MPEPTISPSGRFIKDIVSGVPDKPIAIEEEPHEDVALPISRTAMIPKEEPVVATMPTGSTKQAPVIGNDIERLGEQEEQAKNPATTMQDRAAAKQKQYSGGFPKRLIFISVGIAIVALGAILYITVGKASIILRPHSEPLALKMKVIASTKVQTVDLDLSRIPGQQFSVLKEAKGTYQMTTTKEVAQKAKGRITIYNKSTTPQRLVATTRFETPKGLIFRIPATLTVAASSSIESAVYADRPGTDYNIGATTFTVPGLMGT